MFDFEKFTVYLKAEEFYKLLMDSVFARKFNPILKDQLKRASTSVILNIAE